SLQWQAHRPARHYPAAVLHFWKSVCSSQDSRGGRARNLNQGQRRECHPIPIRSLETYQRAGRNSGRATSSNGAVSFIQYFGGSLNAHPHVHVVFTDGSFSPTASGAIMFAPANPP